MKIGDYVRTEDGIKKIVKYDYDERLENGHSLWFENEKYGTLYTDEEIKELKPSKSIIDLIEVGDYVNGYRVEDVLETFINVATGSNYFQSPTIYEDDVKSIVTREQFEGVSINYENNNI